MKPTSEGGFDVLNGVVLPTEQVAKLKATFVLWKSELKNLLKDPEAYIKSEQLNWKELMRRQEDFVILERITDTSQIVALYERLCTSGATVNAGVLPFSSSSCSSM